MKIVSWNCAMKFREKTNFISKYDADILVIQEAENLDKLNIESLRQYPNRVWLGLNPSKGLLVLAKRDYRIEELKNYPEEYKYILPLNISAKGFEFNLFAVWAQNSPKKKPNSYISQVWLALEKHRDLLNTETILIGDFNSNKIWDKEYKRLATHSQVVEYLSILGINSVYHILRNEEQGGETDKTFYLWRHQDRPFHIDYCFASENLLKRCTKFEIPDVSEFNSEFSKISDHVPLIAEFTTTIV